MLFRCALPCLALAALVRAGLSADDKASDKTSDKADAKGPAKPAETPRAPERSSEPGLAPASRGFLGIAYSELNEVVAFHLKLRYGSGVTVERVVEGSPASKAGIEAKDLILAIDEQSFEGCTGLWLSLLNRHPGEKVKLAVIHRGERRTVEVALGAWPEELLEKSASAEESGKNPGKHKKKRAAAAAAVLERLADARR